MTSESALASDSPSLTEQLQWLAAGDRHVADAVLRSVFPELHRIAMRALGQVQGEPFSATELINEIWLRKLRRGGWKIDNRQHFYGIAAFAMRQVLIELARVRKAERRGSGAMTESLDPETHGSAAQTADPDTVLQLGILMERLEKKNPQAARIVDLRYFAGFTLEEVAEITGLSLRQVRYLWERGCNWLKDGLS